MIKNNQVLSILSLVVLNIVIGFSWIAYHNYQPKLLGLFKLDYLDGFLFYAQWLILSIIPAIAGFVSDRRMYGKQKYFSIYISGIGVAAMTFMAVASGVGVVDIINLRFLVPLLVIIWLVSMNMFHAPANALLRFFGEKRSLPQIMAFLILGTEGIYALEPVIVPLIENLGPSLTFSIGGVLVALAGIWFHHHASQTPELFTTHTKSENTESRLWFWIATVSFGSVYGFLMGGFSAVPGISISGTSANELLAYVLISSAFISYPISFISRIISTEKMVVISWIIAITGILTLFIFDSKFLFYSISILTLGVSLLGVSAFPLALESVKRKNLALGAGVFLGCSEAFEGLFQLLFV